MKHKHALRWGALTIAATLFAGVSHAQADITWRTSLDSAMQEAKKTNKPLVVYFSTTWCGPCQIMKKTTFKDAAVIQESKKWVMVQIDGDKQPSLVQKYKVDGYPTMLALKSSGAIVSRASGGMSAKALISWQQSKYASAKN